MDSKHWMKLALGEARKGWGYCNPNPMVGAVIVRDGVLLGAGYHAKAGCGHAEVNALADAAARGNEVRGAEMYVTLEPCSTTGRTPPCCQAIIAAGISRVVIGCLDANPAHAGAGVGVLQSAGITVESGVLEDECRALNEHFFWWITHRRPWVILKMGISLDGRIALADGSSRWITGAAARQRVQELRQLSGMIMVGGRTARVDDPGLRVVTPADWPRQPIPAVWSNQPLPVESQLSRHEKSRPVVMAKPTNTAQWLEFLRHWGEREVSVLLLEGGGELAANALYSRIVNQVEFFIAPKIIGGRGSAGAVAGDGPITLDESIQLQDVRLEMVGEDLRYSARPATVCED